MSTTNPNNKDTTSTLQSVIDSASGAVQSAIASVTGNPADQKLANEKKAHADVEHDLSHSAAKAGPFTISPSGGVATDSSNRTEGSWNQTVGAGKEAVGSLVGAEGLRKDGIRQNQEGKGQEAQGQIEDLGKGVGDRVGGAVGGVVAGITGDREKKGEYEQQHADGKARQRGVEKDLQKQNQEL